MTSIYREIPQIMSLNSLVKSRFRPLVIECQLILKSDCETQMATSTSDACDRMQCMEVWGGNSRVDRKIRVPGLNVWVHSRPYRPSRRGR